MRKLNLVRIIVGVKRVNELRVEVGVKESSKKKFVRNILTWAGREKQIGDENWESPDSQKVERNRRRGRPTLQIASMLPSESERRMGK